MMEPVNSPSLGAMGSLLRKLDELLRTEDRAQGLIGDLRIISTKMEKISEVHSPPHTVKYWMNDARELSYDMEVCVDLFVHASQPEDLPAKVAWILAWTEEIMGYEARVKEVKGRCESYNLVNRYVLSNPAKILLSHHLRSLNEEPDPVGMEEPTNKILDWMMPKGHTEEDPKLNVVSVLGDEGVGKSTLVKRLWRASSEAKFEFNCRAFVQTAKKPDARMILRSILLQVQPTQQLKAPKVPKLIEDLRKHLQDKRYFIVVDDLWDVSVWHIIKWAFPAGNQRIITSTAVEKVAHVCCSYDSNSIVNVKCLGADQAKKLFVDRAFGSENGCPPQFNDVTDEITRKCAGFPLAIIWTARIVASQPETEQEQQLDYVNKFLPNNLRTHSSSMEILNQVLKLCYSSLPHCLKTCLLYLSVYPENYLFLKEDLVKQWIAEDFICTPEGEDIVDVAGSYFDVLLSLGLVQRMDIVNSYKKGLLSYAVHPVVFDFITCKSMEDNFITIIDYSQSAVVLSEKVRRLSLHFGSATYATTPESVELSQVRSLSFIGLLGCLPSIAEFKLVRVMILHICSDDMDTRFSLSDICHLFQLRYLQVRCNVTVELPKQMQCLKHLGTLEINAGVEDVPSDIVHLLRLWHVRLGEKTKRTPSQISSVDWSGLPCPSISLESFELLHPICIFSRLPQWFIQLRRLRNLEIVVRQLSDDIDALAELPILKHLSLYVRTPPTSAIILSSGMFPALEYFKFACDVLPLGFQKGTLPNLRRLKLVFNAHGGACSYSNMLVGIEHLLSIQKVAGSIGLAPGAEESDRIAAESAFNDAIRKHPCHPSLEVMVKRVDPVDEDRNQQGEEESSNERGQVPISVEKWVGFGSAMAGFGLLWSRMAGHIIGSLVPMVMSYNPYEQITISEYGKEQFCRNKMFDAVSTYLRWACMYDARKLKAELGNKSMDDPLISLDDNQEVVDNFKGVRVWWRLFPKSAKKRRATVVISLPEDSNDEPRCYRLVFHKRHRKLVLESYLPSVVRRWRELITMNRQRLLFTNHSQDGKSVWTSVPYNPPATFDTLAMDHSKKVEIMEDLAAFREAKQYYSKVGKAWKRGYLLHGPPGTGKSTMIEAMANFLGYDVYDLDLTSIQDNAELRKLFLDTTDRSILVIEDIDAIEVELTTKRKGKEAAEENGDKHMVIELSDQNKDKGKVTLSGLLSFVDGLWSACGSERIFVFTTNHVDRLDPALIRRGRMDRHIEMSYCRFEAFKMLAKSYLDITEHSLFGEIGQLLDEIDTTPADVADHLMPRGKRNGQIDRLLEEMNGVSAQVAGDLMLRVKRRREADDCLAGLVETLKKAKTMKSAAPSMDSMEEAKDHSSNSEC